MERLEFRKVDNAYKEILISGDNLFLAIDFNRVKDMTFTLRGASEIVITKDNYQIYEMFDELFEQMRNGQVLLPKMKDFARDYSLIGETDVEKAYQIYEDRINRENARLRNFRIFENMVFGDTLTFYSDASDDIMTAMIMYIKKEDESFVVSMESQNNQDDEFRQVVIRGTNVSRYNPFNIILVRWFLDAMKKKNYSGQMHIEELMLERKK